MPNKIDPLLEKVEQLAQEARDQKEPHLAHILQEVCVIRRKLKRAGIRELFERVQEFCAEKLASF